MKRTVLGVIAAIVIGGGYTGYDYFTGSEFGGPCQWNNDCKGSFFGKSGSQCLDLGQGGFCTVACDDHGECSNGWTCQAFDYYETDQNGNETAAGQNNVCAPPGASGPQPVPGMAPQPGMMPPAVPGQVPQPMMPGQVPQPAPVAQ